jgi:hypothetical protein
MFDGPDGMGFGKAHAAMMISLLRTLRQKGVLSEADASAVIEGALAILEPQKAMTAEQKAIAFIQNDIKPRVMEAAE